MNFAWEFILPMSLLNMLVAGVWHFMAPGVVRWLVCSAIIAAPCILLSAGLRKKKRLLVRTYEFAE